MKKITKEELKTIIAGVERAEEEHPKATVYFDVEEHEIRISYPVPRDMIDVKKLGKYKFES